MPTYVVTIKKTVINIRACEAESPEDAENKIIMRAEGSPADWEVVDVEEVQRPLGGPTVLVPRNRQTALTDPAGVEFKILD